jgi:hypothetical protein
MQVQDGAGPGRRRYSKAAGGPVEASAPDPLLIGAICGKSLPEDAATLAGSPVARQRARVTRSSTRAANGMCGERQTRRSRTATRRSASRPVPTQAGVIRRAPRQTTRTGAEPRHDHRVVEHPAKTLLVGDIPLDVARDRVAVGTTRRRERERERQRQRDRDRETERERNPPAIPSRGSPSVRASPANRPSARRGATTRACA